VIYYLIPARKGSRGWPGKNRVLFKHTAETLKGLELDVIVSTDDPVVFASAINHGFQVIDRPGKLAGDDADIIGVMKHAAHELGMNDDDNIVLLYLVHPTRTREDIENAIKYYKENNGKSLVCRFPVENNPYKCIHADGTPIINHDYYRRQDFPACYEIMHYVAIYKVNEIDKLNKLAFNENTTWLDISQPVDIDYEEDYFNIRGKSHDK